METAQEPLSALLRRYADETGEPRDVPRISFEEAVARGDDPLHVLPYLAGLGIVVRTMDDLLMINGDGGEEEISAFPVEEGVAVVVASDGAWLLFQRGAAL
ncbi:hypothetical protein [Acidisoma sp. C75]